MIGRLPDTLEVGGREWVIRTDYRDILVIMEAYNDPELTDQERVWVMLNILYIDFENMPAESYQEAAEKAVWFLDCGQVEDDKKATKKLMDWEQDEPILFPAINSVAGCEVRAVENLHWWTFMGYFMEIREGVFSTVLNIRQKRSKGKPLDKGEKDFYRNNKALCEIKTKYTSEEQEEREYWKQLLGRAPQGV